MNKRYALQLVIIAVAVVAVLVVRSSRERNAGDRGTIHVSGNIETTVAQVSFKIQGRVLQRLVSSTLSRLSADQALAQVFLAKQAGFKWLPGSNGSVTWW